MTRLAPNMVREQKMQSPYLRPNRGTTCKTKDFVAMGSLHNKAGLDQSSAFELHDLPGILLLRQFFPKIKCVGRPSNFADNLSNRYWLIYTQIGPICEIVK